VKTPLGNDYIDLPVPLIATFYMLFKKKRTKSSLKRHIYIPGQSAQKVDFLKLAKKSANKLAST
jgi:hypothetical protein